jgi:DNA/RNA endonuclease G (NUC1)
MRYGYPGYENLKRLHGYVLSYDRRHRTANWVFERLTKDSLSQARGPLLYTIYHRLPCFALDV